MKQKIKIMKQKQQLPDEEIQKYMNFDQLLDNRKIALTASRQTTFLKWGIPAVTVSAVIVAALLLNNRATEVPNKSKTDEVPQSVQQLSSDASNDNLEKDDQQESNPVKDDLRITQETKKIEPSPQRNVAEKVDEPGVTESGYVQAEPISGYSELYNYFNANLVYPAESLQDSIQGVQTISFVVNKDGKAEQIEVVKSLGIPFEKESRRLIENMPGWKPATLNGKPVASKISLPLTFQIQKIKK